MRARALGRLLLLLVLVASPVAAQTEIFPGRSGQFYNATDYPSFAAAVTALSAQTSTLIVRTAQPVTASLSVPGTITLLFASAGQLSISTGVVVTINGQIQAPRQQIFTGAGTVS